MTLYYNAFTVSVKPDNAKEKSGRIIAYKNDRFITNYVPYGTPADITYKKYTKDYSRTNSRPYVTSFSAFATLEAAVVAFVKRRLANEPYAKV